MAQALKQPSSHPEAEDKQALLQKLHSLAQQSEARCFSLKTANPIILAMRDDPDAALAFLQECGIYDEHGELAAPYR